MLILLLKQILLTFVLFLAVIGSISYNVIRKKQIYVRDLPPAQCQNESIDVLEQEQQKVATVLHVAEVSRSKQIDDDCELLSEIPANVSNDFPLNEKISPKLSRQLICYCDGSYSHTNQIGYSGFRASNGFNKYRRCPLRRSRSGSTESEVFAAYLAIQYTARYQYDTLILYTDNSKVEQLLTRPKTKDYHDYPTVFEALQQCYEGKDHFHIRVEYVRGHTTWYEQQQCSRKREFAKVDRQVRRKRQQHERSNRASDSSHITYSYRYSGGYFQIMQAEKFDTTFSTTFRRRASSFFEF